MSWRRKAEKEREAREYDRQTTFAQRWTPTEEYPRNGATWVAQEEKELLEAFDAGMTEADFYAYVRKLQRKPSAVLIRLTWNNRIEYNRARHGYFKVGVPFSEGFFTRIDRTK